MLGIDPASDVVEQARERLTARALRNAEVMPGDVYTLDPQVERFDVVHAHQVLQHLSDPVAALRAMARLCRPDGLVAARDSDYDAFTWYPLLPELTEWLALYQRAARANGGEPSAGRRLLSWARTAGLTDVAGSASTWCFCTPSERAFWGGMWADRILESAMARQVIDTGLATAADLRRISAGWRRWTDADDGWFAILHGEIICRVPTDTAATNTED